MLDQKTGDSERALIEAEAFALLQALLEAGEIAATGERKRSLDFHAFRCADYAKRTGAVLGAQVAPIKVQIVIEGGCFVCAGASVPLEVEVLDFDNTSDFKATSDFDEAGDVVDDATWWECSIETFSLTEPGMIYLVREREGRA